MSFLQQAYDRADFLRFLKEDFLPDFENDQHPVSLNEKSLLKGVQKLGHSDKVGVTIFEAVCDESDSGKRVTVTQDAFRILVSTSTRNALVVFFSEKTSSWRLSLLTISLELDKNGKVVGKPSNPRRYSYLLGPSSKTVTPHKYLVKNGRVSDIGDLKKRFSVEVVNNEFYREIARSYDSLVGTDTIPAMLKYPKTDEANHQFAVRLIGRIVFCWFLREKYSSAGKPLISSNLLSAEAAQADNYYHSVLAPLFFEVLNKPTESRYGKYNDGSFGEVPYLNGGLFADQKGESGDYYKFDKALGLSMPNSGVEVPDKWLRSFFELLEVYNFTVDENTSVDMDLSIDPEMLGRIFENLLARINPETGETVRKSTGSFYTPREIVEYMVDESLTQYLLSKTGINEEKLRALVSYDLEDDLQFSLDPGEKRIILNALNELKILDPACGSGAFPIGALQKIVFMLQQIDPTSEMWLDIQLKDAPAELRRQLSNQSFDYVRKLGVIRTSIYGVDIQPIAIEIARLRCFLTLIVDQNIDDSAANRGIRVLPNLDFKFVTANTLIKAPGSNDASPALFDTFENQLSEVVDEYFSAEGIDRANLSHELRDLIDAKVNQNKDFVLNNHGLIKVERFADEYNKKSQSQNSKLWHEALIWESYKNIFSHQPVGFYETKYIFPSAKDGFDIVIGNPPYVSTEKLNEPEKSQYKAEFSSLHASRTDIYTYFYMRGIELTKADTGLLCYITSNKWMRAGYGEKLRNYFSQKNPIRLIDFGGFKVFESATVDTNILLIQNSGNRYQLEAAHFKNDYDKSQPIKEYFDEHYTSLGGLGGGTWFIGGDEEQSLKEKIEKAGSPLKDWNIKINYGIKTGLNEAFIVDDVTRRRLIAEDSKSAEIIKPILRGRDIKRYAFELPGLYVLLVGYGMYRTLEEEYPAVYRYLLKHELKLKERGQCKGSRSGKRVSADFTGQHHWLELDNNPSSSYFGELEKDKIVWPMVTSNKCSFSLVGGGIYLNNKCFFITSGALDLRCLIAVLNSSLAYFYFKSTEAALGSAIEIRTDGLKKFPFPRNPSVESLSSLGLLVDKLGVQGLSGTEKTALESKIDEIVYGLYDLTLNEIEIIGETER